MFSKIVVALNDLPESQRALRTAIELARACKAELATVSILGDLPAYTSFAIVVDPNAPNAMMEDRRQAHKEMHEKASLLAQEHGCSREGLDRRGAGGACDTSFSKEQNMPICSLLAFISTTSICPVFGVPFMTLPRKLPAAYSECTEIVAQNQRGVSVETGLALGGFTT